MPEGKREWIAIYKYSGEWRLITRELATERHASKMAEQYKASGYTVKTIKVV